jgi:acetolactate synthase-1/2/3 large subunit
VRSLQVFSAAGAVCDPVKQLKQARRPVLLVGHSAVWSEAGAAVRRLAEALQCPVVVSPMAKGIVNETHASFAGTLDMACNAFVWDFLRRADLLLAVGFDAVELIKPWTLKVPTIHIDSVPNSDQVYSAELELVGDIAQILDALGGADVGPGDWTRAELTAHRARLRELYTAGRVSGRLNPSDVVDLVRAASPADAIASTDVGSHKLLVGQGWTTHRPRRMLMSNGLSSMGYSLPAAITAQLLNPTQPVVCFTGDGGLAMVQAELRVAATLGVAPLVVVFCDGSLNRIELKQAARQYPSWGTRIDPTDIAMLAEAMGCDGVNVDSAKGLEAALATSRSDARPLVIGARIAPDQYAAQF